MFIRRTQNVIFDF